MGEAGRISSLLALIASGNPTSPYDPRQWAADQHIRNQGQHRGQNQRFDRVKPVESNQLIDQIYDDCDDEDLSHVFPSLLQKFSPLYRIAADCPKVRRAVFTHVFQRCAGGKYRSNERLEEEAKRQRATRSSDQVSPKSNENVFHENHPVNFASIGLFESWIR